PITEGPRSLQHSTCRDQACAARQHECPQPAYRIAVMIDVNDLAQIVRPACPAMRLIHARPARRWFVPGQHGCDRGEEIAPMKAGRKALRLPVNVPAALVCGTALNQLE